MRPTQKILGRELSKARRAAFLTQRQLAEMVGVAEGNIARIEQTEIAGIDLFRVPRFAAALKITTDVFLSRFAAAKNDKPTNGTPRPTAAENEPAPAGRIGPRTLHLDAVPEIERDWIEAAAARDGALPAQVMLRLVLKGLAAERRERPDDELGYGEAASPRDSTDDPRPPKTPKKPKKPKGKG